jgi:hypothetical protein
MSGCISSASPGTEPETTPTLQVVHGTVPVTPSPTLTIAIPVGIAVETPPATQPVHEMVFVTPTTVLFRPTTDNRDDESEYHYEYLKPMLSADDVTGSLVIRVEGCSAEGLTVFIARNVTNDPPVDNTYLLDRMVAGDQNPVFLPVKILPDGSSEMERLAPGEYSAYLPNKDGDEIEDLQTFKIGANFMTFISLSGSSYSTPSSGCSGCSCRR